MNTHQDCATHSHLMKTIHSMGDLRGRITELEKENAKLNEWMQEALEKIRRLENQVYFL